MEKLQARRGAELITGGGRSSRLKLLPSSAQQKEGEGHRELLTFKVAVEIQIFLTSQPIGIHMLKSFFFFLGGEQET